MTVYSKWLLNHYLSCDQHQSSRLWLVRNRPFISTPLFTTSVVNIPNMSWLTPKLSWVLSFNNLSEPKWYWWIQVKVLWILKFVVSLSKVCTHHWECLCTYAWVCVHVLSQNRQNLLHDLFYIWLHFSVAAPCLSKVILGPPWPEKKKYIYIYI